MPERSTAADGEALAGRVRDAMFAADRASRALGIAVRAVGPGRATLEMAVRADMLNGLDTCHGGLIATLADSAFAFACNSRNQATVAAGFDIQLLAPGREGDVLTAEAHELHLGGRTGVYDVVVANQRGERVALFRGRSHALGGRSVVAAPGDAGPAAG